MSLEDLRRHVVALRNTAEREAQRDDPSDDTEEYMRHQAEWYGHVNAYANVLALIDGKGVVPDAV